MPSPWGLSGPEFLQLYWIGLALAVLVAIVVRVRVRAGHSTQPVRSLDMDELAYLAGGPRRVVETSIARLLTAGELRTSRRGTVQATSTTQSLNQVDRAVITDTQRYTNRTVNLMIPAVAKDGVVTSIGQRLEDMGLLVNPDVMKSAVRKGSIVLWVLLVIGYARWINGLAIGANIGWLTLQLIIGTALVVLLMQRGKGVTRTSKGNQVLSGARGASTRASGSVDEVMYAGAAGAVLFGGLLVYPDLAVRSSLLASSGSGSPGYSSCSSSSSSCSSGSSSCSSGSSCGGGGGGCGGGGGG